jgi:DNA-binding NtrC family response regulator
LLQVGQAFAMAPIVPEILSTPALAALRRVAEQVAASPDTPVLIVAEPGCGADELAEVIHLATPGVVDGRFVSIRCRGAAESAIHRDLLDAVGEKRGGAGSAAEPLLSGTLFVEDVSLLGDDDQARLSAFIDEQRRGAVGTGGSGRVRVIGGVGVPLEVVAQRRSFRADLREQLSVVKLVIPPLRDRPNEIVVLARIFLANRSRILGKTITDLSDRAIAKLVRHTYSGNARELAAIIERAVILETDAVLQERSVTFDDLAGGGAGGFFTEMFLSTPAARPPSLEELERAYITWLLKRTLGNRTEAARTLGVSYPTIMKKIHDYQIDLDALVPRRRGMPGPEKRRTK